VVRSGASAVLVVPLPARLFAANSFPSQTWQRIRRLMGGPLSALSSAADMRADGRVDSSEVSNRATSTSVRATPASVRAAVEAMVADIFRSNQFI